MDQAQIMLLILDCVVFVCDEQVVSHCLKYLFIAHTHTHTAHTIYIVNFIKLYRVSCYSMYEMIFNNLQRPKRNPFLLMPVLLSREQPQAHKI